MIKTDSQPSIPAQSQPVTELQVPQLQFKPTQYTRDLAPRYNYVPVSIQSGNPTFTLGASTTEIRQFDIAPGALNLSRSFLTYKQTIPAPGSSTAMVWSHEDTFAAISKFEVMFHRGGTHLANVDYFPQHMKLALKRQKRKAFHLEDRINGLYASNRLDRHSFRSDSRSALNYIEPRYFRGGNDEIDFTPVIPKTDEYKVDGTTKAVTIETGNVGQNLKIAEYVASNNNTANVLEAQLPLRAISDTICEVDADIDFDERLIMRLTFGPGSKIGFKTSGADFSAVNPGAGTVAELDADKPVSITDIVLWVAYVETPEIKKILQEQVRGQGINITVPYLYSNTNSFIGKGTAMQWTLSGVNGRKLKKIESAIFDARESKEFTFNQDNRLAAGKPKKVTKYFTQMGPDRLQYGDVDCTANMDWILNKRHWEDAPYATLDVYKYNWFHIDDFADTDLEQKIPNIDSGLVLDRDRIYQFQIATKENADNMILYSFATCTRLLHIQSGQKSGFV